MPCSRFRIFHWLLLIPLLLFLSLLFIPFVTAYKTMTIGDDRYAAWKPVDDDQHVRPTFDWTSGSHSTPDCLVRARLIVRLEAGSHASVIETRRGIDATLDRSVILVSVGVLVVVISRRTITNDRICMTNHVSQAVWRFSHSLFRPRS